MPESALRRNRHRAIAEWECAVRTIPAAALLDRDELREHMPQLVDRLLELVELPETSANVERVSGRHAVELHPVGRNGLARAKSRSPLARRQGALRCPAGARRGGHRCGQDGSRTASDFAAEDRLILRSTADRAAAFIAQKCMAEDRELLLHVLAHDLRSPLNSIVLGVRLLGRKDPVSTDVAGTADRVLASAYRMDRLIADMTDFTQTRISSTLALQREMVDLAAPRRADRPRDAGLR